MYLFESSRLGFRELSAADAQFAYDLNSDIEVVQYTGDSAFASVEAAARFLKGYRQVYDNYGCGRWGLELKETGDLVGWCGLKFHSEQNFYDVGYRFFKYNWGKGYATESCLRTLEHGFNTMGLTSIIAHARKENLASIRVLQKCGLVITGEGEDCGGGIYSFEITADEYRAHRSAF